MLYLKLARVIWHILVGVMTCAVVFPFTSQATHERLIQRWSQKLINLFGITLQFIDRSQSESEQLKPNAMIIANHISWIDIFVINTHQPCQFVAKSDIRNWPIAGWLSAQAGTIFLARGKQREVRRIYEGLVHQLQDQQRVAFFPEGTTGAQGGLLPFHANLFEAAIEAKVPVQPYVLRYVDQHNNLHPAADFIGDMTMLESMFSIFKAGKIQAQLIQLPLIQTQDKHRRDIARAANQAVAQELGLNVGVSL